MAQTFSLLGVEMSSTWKVNPADPRVAEAVRTSIATQQPFVHALFGMSQHNHKGQQRLDELASENDRIPTLEREIATLERRLTNTEQERDLAQARLEKELALHQGRPKVVQVSLVDRLSLICAD